MTTGWEDLDALAAEFVLGTLDLAQRREIESRRQTDPALDQAIAEWEARLSPLLREAGEVPPPDVLDDVMARIRDREIATPVSGDAAHSNRQVIELRKQLLRWRKSAVIAYAVAACLLGVIVFHDRLFPPQVGEQKFVAVFQEGDKPPEFLLSIDLKTRQLTIRRISAQRQPGKTYQLWIASEKIGTAPRSLGLIDAGAAAVRKNVGTYEADLLRTATFGISLEPEGGSPTGRPSGPALHGKLIPATP